MRGSEVREEGMQGGERSWAGRFRAIRTKYADF